MALSKRLKNVYRQLFQIINPLMLIGDLGRRLIADIL